jgi:uncharacterized protein
MKNTFVCFIIFLVISLNIPVKLFSQSGDSSLIKNPPMLKEYVTDETGTLTQVQLDNMRKKLKTFRDSTSTQIVVYMIKTLNGEPIEEVSYAIADINKIGRKGSNNGVLLLIAKDDHKLRLEVGYGLEGVLTDAMSKHISRTEITPNFKKEDYFTGIDKGINAIMATVKGEYQVNVKNLETKEESPAHNDWLIAIIVFGFIFGGTGLLVFLAVRSARKGGGRGGSGGYSSGGWTSSGSGSSSSSDSSSSSSSDSGFSGDGGSFGGGGASDDW